MTTVPEPLRESNLQRDVEAVEGRIIIALT